MTHDRTRGKLATHPESPVSEATCTTCGDALSDVAYCIVPTCPYRVGSRAQAATLGQAVVLPRADLARRLGASGLEFLILFGLEVASAIIVPVGMALSLLAGTYFAVKDLGGGRYSLGKRIARTRVVDAETGAVPPAARLVMRNAHLALGFWLSVIPGLEVLGWALLLLGGTIDLLMLVADPQGRRLGDRIAGTQVVPVTDG